MGSTAVPSPRHSKRNVVKAARRTLRLLNYLPALILILCGFGIGMYGLAELGYFDSPWSHVVGGLGLIIFGFFVLDAVKPNSDN